MNIGQLNEIEGYTEVSSPSRFRDPITQRLGILSSHWESVARSYQAASNLRHHVSDLSLREIVECNMEQLYALRESIGKLMTRTLSEHILYPWMRSHTGFPCAVHTARLLSKIGDPLRFPGRKCVSGHYTPEDYPYDICCVLVSDDDDGNGNSNGNDNIATGKTGKKSKPAVKVCGAELGPIRRGTGTRALWHFCGVHCDSQGKFAKQSKGVKGSWSPSARNCLLMKDFGIAYQLIKFQVQPWVEVHDREKERIARERGEYLSEIEGTIVNLSEQCFEVEDLENAGEESSRVAVRSISSVGSPLLRPFQIEQRARIIMVKAMIADLLTEWKRLVKLAPDNSTEHLVYTPKQSIIRSAIRARSRKAADADIDVNALNALT